MFLMNKFWAEYNCEAEGDGLIGQDPGNFSMVLQEQRKPYAGFEPLQTLTHNDPPMWLKSDLIKMMQLLITAEFGLIKYKTACETLGKSVVHSLI